MSTELARRTTQNIYREIQKVNEQLAKNPTRHVVSAPALHAARTLLNNFTVAERRNQHIAVSIPVTEYNVAVLIDLCTNIFRLEPFRAKAGQLAAKVETGTATREELNEFFGELSIAFNRMPSY